VGAGGSKIDDAEATVAQIGLTVLTLPLASGIGATMPQGIGHALKHPLIGGTVHKPFTKEASDTAHNSGDASRAKFSNLG
jgi:hypothetical protein